MDLYDFIGNDDSIVQGVEFFNKQREAIEDQVFFNINLLEQTTSPELGSLIEGLENMTINQANAAVTSRMKSLESDFNTKLSEYTSLYSEYLQKVSSQSSTVDAAEENPDIKELKTRIAQLNNELISISDDMYNTITNVDVKDKDVNRKLVQVREQLLDRIKELSNEREQIMELNKRIQSLEGEFDDTKLDVTRDYTHYMVWTIASITLAAFAVKYVLQ